MHIYYVMQDETGWVVQSDGENSEPSDCQYRALSAAIGLAQLDERQRRPAKILAQGSDGMFRAAWHSDTAKARKPVRRQRTPRRGQTRRDPDRKAA